ncbi:lysylphosphatidylglycerol synthase transmembrane domain-containing protein [Ilumatobacter sp.]|uniref:lysylphosphatidylglycerol synthase transmembrane domain-containing protein n=1 Tax=Ilumatobacter sp. TaxID=1967498 RepID=UPI003AF52F86
MSDSHRPASGPPDAADEVSEDAEHERKVKRRRRIELAVSLVLLFLLFGVILPQVIDYRQVWDAITGLSADQVAVLLVLGLIRIGIAAAQHAAVIPSLGYRAALRAYLASGTLAELAPPPGDLAIRYGMYRAQGVDAEASGVGIMLTGLFDNAAKLLLPVVGLGVLVIAGVDDATTRQLFTIGLLAALSMIVLVVFLVRSERFTLAFGRFVGRVISGLLVKFGKNPLDDLGPKTVSLRERIGGTVRDHWLAASAATLGVHLMNYVILLVAFRFLGVEAEQLDWVVLLVAYAVVVILTALPLTPGGIGVASLGYTWLLAPGDPDLANLIASASLLNKVFTWLLPIVVGLIPLANWRRNQPDEPPHKRETGASVLPT